jgi:tRNA-splicing ligase RtcB
MQKSKLRKINEFIWEIPRSGEMLVNGIIIGDEQIIDEMDEKVFEQLSNVAALPGIVGNAYAMPDAHWGYGFPIGGVAGFDPDIGGIISIGGVGYDISCGVRSAATNLTRKEITPYLERFLTELFRKIPSGVGSEGKLKLSFDELDELLTKGANWALHKGLALEEDLLYIEDNGMAKGANPGSVSDEAKKRQQRQTGTLGSGNHYLEIQYVEKIFDDKIAEKMGLFIDGIVISIHCGSRALGHQIATDYLSLFHEVSLKYNIPIKEKELVCAPINSPEGKKYFSAMQAGINCALTNRQVIFHNLRKIFHDFFPGHNINLIYDVSHNTCKVEEHNIDGKIKKLYVHRKGATRALGPGSKILPEKYRETGQPVFIGGSMGTYSYILAGANKAEELSLNSTCHGAGRAMSRHAALKKWRGEKIIKELAGQGIIIKTSSMRGASEEAPDAYKDVNIVVDASCNAGITQKVALLRPLGCVKG